MPAQRPRASLAAAQRISARQSAQPNGNGAKQPKPAKPTATGEISAFLHHHFGHYNAGCLIRAADAYKQFVEQGNLMMITLAGAMSTAELGKSLAEMIRQEKVHAISTTGANLEEDVFNLVGKHDYEPLPDYRDLTPQDDQNLRNEGKNRVTDTAIPDEQVVKPVTEAITQYWQAADKAGDRKFPHEFLYEVLLNGDLKDHYEADPNDSWLLAAAERNLPIITPGWEDSTLGNAFASACMRGEIEKVNTVRSGLEAMIYLAGWYAQEMTDKKCGFCQLGGGIAGDCPICVVPMLQLELDRKDLPLWGYFLQITDSVTSYGGYSGAIPSEKISWGKLSAEEKDLHFNIESDASIVAPLLFAIVLNQ